MLFTFFVGRIIKDVASEMKTLISNRDLVLEKVEANTQPVNYAVFKWLNDVQELIKDEEMLGRKENKSVFGIPNCYPRDHHEYRYKKFDEMLERIKALNAKCDFQLFFNPIPGSVYSSPLRRQRFSTQFEPVPASFPSFVCFDSQKEASDQLWKALQDDNTSVIGLYGMPGSGKTQLVKALVEKAKYFKIFKEVGFGTVSKNPNVKRIQEEILLSLSGSVLVIKGIKINKTEDEMASSISVRLGLHTTLIILDDVREKFDLKYIGFPPRGRDKVKVLLITRSQQELVLMGRPKEIPLHPLSKEKEEAWTLFRRHSGINDNSSSDLLNVAQQVLSECEGLPGKIIKVGSSLKSEPIEVWKASLHALRHSTARYHIFLSFRGEDTRHTFTGYLYQALCEEGFKTFMDDGIEGLHGGELISPFLIEAIETSRLSIIVLSENYANSSWCLNELVKILECMKTKNQLVLPIFYKVEPSDVRCQNKSYANAMAKHERRFGTNSQEVQEWKSALFQVSNLPGYAYETGSEYEFIQKIVKDVNSFKRALCLYGMDID